MGVPKRKAPGGQDGAASRVGAAKRARAEELTGVRFKAQLRDPQGAEPGECGAGRGGEHARARRVPAAALCQAQPSSVQLFGPELQSRAFRFADGETEAVVLGHPGPRAARAAVGPRAALPCPGLSATAGGPTLLGCDSSTRLHASLGRAASLSRLKTSLLQLLGKQILTFTQRTVFTESQLWVSSGLLSEAVCYFCGCQRCFQ